jgi:hypothetical protein
MGAFKNKSKTIHINEYSREFFFSTDHMQETDKLFVPISFYGTSAYEITETHKDLGYKEIDNPDPDFKP